MGCGFVAVVPEADADAAIALLAAHHPGTRRIGTVTDEAGRVSAPGVAGDAARPQRRVATRPARARARRRSGSSPGSGGGVPGTLSSALALPVLARVGDLLAELLGALLELLGLFLRVGHCAGLPVFALESPPRMYDFTDKTVLITGGTGSFGNRLVDRLLAEHAPRAIRVFSRDEYKQSHVARRLADDDRMRYLIGDVRSLPRLIRATRGVDVIIHAAAMKHVPACEYNPFEAVKTNVMGAENVVAAAMRERRAATPSRCQHRQGCQPGQPLRRDEARHEKIVDPEQCVRGGLAGALRDRALRQRGRESRHRGTDASSRQATRVSSRSPTSG